MKKIMSIFLSIVMLLSVSVTAFAQGEAASDKDPMVFVTGFAMTTLLENEGTDEQQAVFFPQASRIESLAGELAAPLATYLVTKNNDKFAESVTSSLNTFLEPLRCDDDGNSISNKITTEKKNVYRPNSDIQTFYYDWRLDIETIADQLNNYIEYIKSCTSHNKVALKATSMGGAVTMNYLCKYGDSSVSAVIMMSSATMGITLVGCMFTKDFAFDNNCVIGYIKDFLMGQTSDKIIYRALLDTYGADAIGPVVDSISDFILAEKDYLYENSLKDLFGNIPGIWAFVPDEFYEQAKQTMLDENINSKLITKIDNYEYNIRPQTKTVLQKCMDDGINVAIISNYALYPVPVVNNGTYQSDFLIDTKYTSMGATCANIGTTLGDNYVQAVSDSHNHLSSDGIIDASTCDFPEITWFVKGMIHTFFTDGYDEFVNYLAYSDTQVTVNDADYPQFMVNNYDEETLDPLSDTNSDVMNSKVTINIIIDFIKTLISKLVALFA